MNPLLYEELERVKIRFLAAFDRLQQKGLLTQEEWNEVTQLLDEMDDMPEEAWTEKLQALRDRVKARLDRGGSPIQ